MIPGLGLRSKHYSYVLENNCYNTWFEVISENYMTTKGRPLEKLIKIREKFDIALHGVGLSIASAEALNWEYLKSLKTLIDVIDPIIVSDHLCWTGYSAHNSHDLLPFPKNQDSLKYISAKIQQVQDYLKREVLFENISNYLEFKSTDIPEEDFLMHLHSKTGCKILLDLNNIYVNSQNFNFSPKSYIDKIKASAIGQVHLAGFSDMGDFLFDTHSAQVFPEVWDLYKYALPKIHNKHILIEWDDNLPDFPILENEIKKATQIWENYYG